jgi:hypothetical protein
MRTYATFQFSANALRSGMESAPVRITEPGVVTSWRIAIGRKDRSTFAAVEIFRALDDPNAANSITQRVRPHLCGGFELQAGSPAYASVLCPGDVLVARIQHIGEGVRNLTVELRP